MTQDNAKFTDAAGNSYYRPQGILNMRINLASVLSRLAELFLTAMSDVLFDESTLEGLNSRMDGRII